MKPAVQPAFSAPPPPTLMERILIGPDGLRSGWTLIVICAVWRYLPLFVAEFFFLAHLIDERPSYTASDSFFRELVQLSGLLGAVFVSMRLRSRPRHLLEFNLTGPARGRNFAFGIAAGFAAIALLVIALRAGGWLTLVPSGLAAGPLLANAFVWGLAFLTVGIFEEGTFRCYLQATLTRQINLWWALALEAGICGYLLATAKGNGAWGVYAMALVGLGPCLGLALRKPNAARFWLAAWVTSTLFGAVHTGNNGENWIGIFQAGAIGFVFVASVWLTGSAWWAIGFHAAWDWGETFFFGTADSGLPARGSLLISRPLGNPFWSGGTDGPEGSILTMAVILLVLAGVVAAYGRGHKNQNAEQQAEA